MCARPRLRIAYLCDLSPLDRNPYSGGNARIHDALSGHADEVSILPNTWGPAEPLRRLIHRLPDGLNMRGRWRAHLALSRITGALVTRKLAEGDCDAVFCAYAFQALAHVKPPGHMITVFTSDATNTVFRNSEMGRFHKSSALGRSLDGWTERHERRVFRNADLLIWPSRWIKEAAEARYGLDESTSKLVPWGANIAAPAPSASAPISRDLPLRLLLIGRNWWTKGGPLAVETLHLLRADGIDAHLTVIGCQPPPAHCGPHVTVHRQLDKAVPGELALFQQALDSAHFLLMPSIESYGFVFCEASAYGIPSLCLRVGGVPVRDGVNGFALPQGSTSADFAALINRFLGDADAYAALTLTTRREFDERLNWNSWADTVTGLMREAVARRQHDQAQPLPSHRAEKPGLAQA